MNEFNAKVIFEKNIELKQLGFVLINPEKEEV